MAWTSFGTGNAGLAGQRNENANIREDLSNMISNIDRDETPFLSSIGSNKATGPLHEWLTDGYADPAANVQGEGFTFDATRAGNRQNARARIDNRTQIFGKDIVASGSTISSDVAGVANEFAYQLKKAGVELRRDIDFQMTRWSESGNATAGAGVVKRAATGTTDSNAGQMASVFAYASHAYNNAGTGGPALVSRTGAAVSGGVATTGGNIGTVAFADAPDGTSYIAYGATAPTAAQRQVFSRDALESLLTSMFNQGGKPTMAQIPSGLKSSVSSALIDGGSGSAQRRADEMAKKLNLAVMGVMTDFGFDISLVPNYIMHSHSGAANAILVYDPKMVKRSVLTPMATEEDRVARYGRAAIMYCEETLEVMNPHSVGVIAGVTA